MFFYRADGLFRYYNISSTGHVGSPLAAGSNYTHDWSAITAVDLDFNQPPVPPTVCEAQTVIPEAECDALQALYLSTGGASWTLRTGWNAGNPCTWLGVTCAGGHVTVIDLEANNLSGTLPTTLGNLTGLQDLSLENNLLTGPLPSSFTNLASIRIVKLSGNSLTGSIPTFPNAANLTELNLGDNGFTGGVPTALNTKTSLQILDLAENALGGTLPNLGNLDVLTILDISEAGLSGTLNAASLPGLANIQNLDLSSNGFTGAVPAFAQPTLSVLDLSENSLSGALNDSLMSTGIPTAIASPGGLALCGNLNGFTASAGLTTWLNDRDPLFNSACGA
jgi:Leucine-rich repeat (LRR) protein